MKMRAFAAPLLLLYPLYAGVMFTKQEAILFPGTSATHHAYQVAPPENGRLVEMPASFGRVRAVYLCDANRTAPGPAILYAHGNFERIEDSFLLLQPLVHAGIPVLQLEYPGYGGADGKPTYAAVNEAATVAYDWLAQQPGVDAQRIVVMGYSIGGGAAGELTRTRPVAALVLLSTFTSIEDIAHRYLLPGFLTRYQWDTLARLKDYSGPVFVEHGRHDEVIPFAFGQRLAAAAPQAQFAPLICGHADCHFDLTVFAERIPRWLESNHLLAAQAPVAVAAR